MLEQLRPKSQRRRFRLSVRGAIVSILFIGGWLGWIVHSARVQRDATTALEQAGYSWYFDWQWNDHGYIESDKPWAPRWLVNWIGPHYFGRVNCVRFFPIEARRANDDLAVISRLYRLEELDLHGAYVTNAALAHLEGMTSLRRLELELRAVSDLDLGGVSDAGIAHLAGLTNLQTLNLRANRLSDAGIAHLAGLTNLQTLDLGGGEFSDAGIAHLRGLTNLRELWLHGTKISDVGMAHLRGLTNLQSLWLISTRIGDAGVAHLRGLTNLQNLWFDGTKISNAGLVHLKGLPRLRCLRLAHTRITDRGLVHLSADFRGRENN
jgi:hypothetical protein